MKAGGRRFTSVAVTGGVASGKSTVCSLLVKLGAVAIDADKISREVTAPGSETLRNLVRRFGSGIKRASGELDRKELARIAFSSPENVRDLNALTHPPIRKAIRAKLEGLVADGYDGVVAVEAALFLEEGGALDLFDTIVAVICSESSRAERLSRLEAGTAEQMRARARSQMPDSRKAELADYVIQNDGDMDELEAKTRDLWDWLSKRRSAGPRDGA